MKILPEKYQLFERIKIAQLKTLPEKKWGFLRSFFDESRGYRVRKPGLGIKSFSYKLYINILYSFFQGSEFIGK